MSRTIDCNPTLASTRAPQTVQSVLCANPRAAAYLDVPYVSLDRLATEVCQDRGWTIAPPLIAHRNLQATLQELYQTGAWQGASDRRDVAGTVRNLRPAVRALLRSGVDLSRLATAPDIADSVAPSNLVRLTRGYRDRLHARGYCDRAELFWIAAGLSPEPQSLLIYGHAELTGDRLAFLDAAAAEGSLLHLPCSDAPHHADNRAAIAELQARGWTASTPQPLTPPSTAIALAYANLDDEVRGVLGRVKSLIRDGIDARDIVLVTRRESDYADTVLDVAWEYDLPVRAFYAVPLSDTRLGSWVQALLDAVSSGFDFEPTARLLRHPLSPPPTVVGKLNWQQVRLWHPARRDRWQACGANFDDVKPLRGRSTTRANWVQRFRGAIAGWNLAQRCQSQARDVLALQQLQAGLDTLAQVEGGERLSFDDFARDLRDSLSLLEVPAQPGRGGIALHTPLSVFGARYAHVFVLGMAEGMFPAPLDTSAVLDFFLRKRLQRQGFPISTAVNAARREAVSFSALLPVATQQLHLSYPQQIGKTPRFPSPYLAQFGIAVETAVRGNWVASPEELRQRQLRRVAGATGDRVLARAVRNWAIELRRESQQPGDRFDGVTDVAFDLEQYRFSASQLTALGQCGFKWFARYLLHVGELAEAETELSGRLRGSLYHTALELATRSALHAEPPAEELRQALLDRLDTAFAEAEERENLPPLAAWSARRTEHLDRLRRTIADASFLEPDAHVVGVERAFEGDWYGFRVRGKIDRLDETPEGYLLVEYKNRSSRPTRAKDDKGKTTLDVQLPLYADVVGRSLAMPGDRPVRAHYYSLTKAKSLGSCNVLDAKTQEELEAFADRIKTQLRRGAYTVEPDVQQNACQYCVHDALCRRGARLQRKAGANGVGQHGSGRHASS